MEASSDHADAHALSASLQVCKDTELSASDALAHERSGWRAVAMSTRLSAHDDDILKLYGPKAALSCKLKVLKLY